MIVPRASSHPKHHKSCFSHDRISLKYDELPGADPEIEGRRYHWWQWLQENLYPPRVATLYRPLLRGEDVTRCTPSRQLFYGEVAVPVTGIYTFPDRWAAEKMVSSRGGRVLEVKVDFTDVDRVAVCLWSVHAEFEMCRLSDYMEFRKHHRTRDTDVHPDRKCWPVGHPTKDPKDYTTIIMIPPTSALTCFVVLKRRDEMHPISVIGAAHVANEDA